MSNHKTYGFLKWGAIFLFVTGMVFFVNFTTMAAPIVELKFNENTGSSAVNTGTSGGSATLTTTRPTWSTMAPPNGGASAIDFGTTPGNYAVDLTSAVGNLKGLKSFTITGWVNCRSNTVGSGGNRIVSWINNGGDGVDLVFLSDGSLQVGIDQWPDGSPARSSSGKITTDANAGAANWRFFAVTYDPALSAGDVKFFFGTPTTDAILDVSKNYDQGNTGAHIGPALTVGHFNAATRSNATDRMFRGVIDQIRVYGSTTDSTAAFTLSQIVAIQRETLGTESPTPTATSSPTVTPTVSVTPTITVSVSATVTVTPTSIAGNLFYDDFEDGEAGDWTNYGGTWAIVTDGTKVYNQSVISGTNAGINGNSAWTDYSVSCRMKIVTGGSSNVSLDLMGRYTDGNNFYYLRLNQSTNQVQLLKKTEGTVTTLQSVSFTVNTGQWYLLKLTFSGTAIKGYVDGTEMISLVDSSLSAGNIGIRTNNTTASFDEVTVSENTVPVPTVSAPVATPTTGVTTYYVDAVNGSDTNSGLSPEQAWKSLSKVNSRTFVPGEVVRFKAGCTWYGTLAPKGSGTETSRIVFGRYGDSSLRPCIHASGNVEAVRLQNMAYVTVEDFEITNPSTTTLRVARGIYIYGTVSNTYRGIIIRNNDLHDIVGHVVPAYRKDCGAIHTNSSVVDARFEDMLIEGNRITNITVRGVVGNQTAANVENLTYMNDGLTVRNNNIDNTGCDAIRITGWKNALVEYNTIYRVGGYTMGQEPEYIAACFPQQAVNTTWQFNEIAYTARTTPPSGDMDSQAFDVDHNCGGYHLFQHNYTHDNYGGFMLFMGSIMANTSLGPLEVVVRYNISQNDGPHFPRLFELQDFGGKVFNIRIYNNTFYYGTGNMAIQCKGDDFHQIQFNNNIFYAPFGTYPAAAGIAYDNNLYYGHSAPSGDAHAVTANPMLISPGTGGEGMGTVDGYKLNIGSPAIARGKTITNNGGRDFWGNIVPSISNPDIGAHQNGVIVTPTPTTTATPTVTVTITPTATPTASITVTPTPTATSSSFLFRDDFEDGVADGWTSYNGAWSVIQDGTKVYNQSLATGTNSVINGASAWTNYSVSCRMKIVTAGASGVSLDLMGRYVDGNNFYYLRLNLATNQIQLLKKVGGTITTLQSVSFTVHTGQWYTLKITFFGNNIHGYVDGQEKVNQNDTSLTIGKIGIRTNNTAASFDDVAVEQE